ncbi:hypothetical protein RRF57_008637 [Xylaria bambusicola]|uniref:Uncharacterized protein n=1 Tax=Xylaria bambusicola TaxID=326684 RepID=A0AAN7UYB7_9PEZI
MLLALRPSLDTIHHPPQADTLLGIRLEPCFHALTNAFQTTVDRHPHLNLALDVRAGIEQDVEAVRPYIRLPVPLERLADFVLSSGRRAEAALVRAHCLNVLAEEQAVHNTSEPVVVELPSPRPALADLGAVLLRRLPVSDELHVLLEGTYVDAAPEVDKDHPARRPVARAVRKPLIRKSLCLELGLRRGKSDVVETQQAIISL